jgi:hypothetical protein
VDQPVVPPAEQHQVPERGGATLDPVLDVVRIAPRVRTVAAGEPAVPVAHDHGPPQGRGDQRGAPADVERLRRAGHDDPHHRGVARHAPGDLARHRSGVIQLTGLGGSPAQRLDRHRHGEVRPFAADHGTIRVVEPLATDLADGVRTPLRGCPVVVAASRSGLRTLHRTQRRQQRLPRLRVQLAVHTDHAEERDRRVERTPAPERRLAVRRPFVLGPLAPEAHHLREVLDRVPARRIDKLFLAASERVRVDALRGRQQARGRQRDVARLQRGARLWHLVERSAHAYLVPGRPPRHPMPNREPRGGREVPVAFEQTPPVDLREAPQALDLEQLDRPLQVGELLLDARVGQLRQRLRSKSVDDRTKLTHVASPRRLRLARSRHSRRDSHARTCVRG